MARNKGRGRGQPGNHRSRNIYGTLAADDDGNAYGSRNMKSHLTERFGAAHGSDDRYPDPEKTPLSRPARTNDDISKYYQDAIKPVVNAGSWIHKPEFPNASELLPSTPNGFAEGEQIINLNEELRPNKVEGAYESNEEYLGTQYDLLREDAIRPLRQAVQEVRKDPWRDESDYPPSSGIGIYEPVYLKAVQFAFRGLSAKMAFSLNRVKKQIRWRQSKRLIAGTLVALSPADDAFEDPSKVLFAVVGARPITGLEINNPPEIDLFFARPEEYDWDPTRKWIMVESRSSFFEASRHTLLALQHMMREPFPLSEHIVKAQKEVGPPEYVRLTPDTNLSSLVSIDEADRFKDVNILKEWPAGDDMTLDNSQSKALKRMMTKSLAVVQGPPGTGKTYVSVIDLKTKLDNMRRGDPPIIVTCQTNHALDQLLRHVAEFEPNFVRLGGQTKDQDKIKQRTLYEVRGQFEQPKILGNRKNRAMGAMRQLTAKMQMLLAPFERNKPPLDHRLLVKLELLTEKQAESLVVGPQAVMGVSQDTPGAQMEIWLGRCLQPCERPYQPDDFGMPYEEEDFDEAEQLEELEAEAVARDDDDNIEALRGPVMPLSDNFRGMRGGKLKGEEDVRRKLDNTDDLTTIEIPDRGAIYNYLLRKAKQKIMWEFRGLAKEYAEQVNLRKIGQWEEDQGVLMQQRIIGMTTTGLSKYRALISSLRPRVVLIEEAAETLEAPVTAACFPTLEHLILVGDHQQLRPHCNLHEFEDEPYNFNLSLFERLVSNDIELDTLRRQRRMIPEIRRLLQPIYGDKLKDHPSVKREDNRPPVEGMGGVNSFFFTHEWPESRDNNQSAKNENEADMIVGFFDYLVLNGIDSAKITVLTFYNGQRKLLTKKLRQHANLSGQTLKVVTVDSYQGEENDIILLSLVRSSSHGNIGFLSVDNRVCVALSRARRGFYLFGNAEKLVCGSDTWESVAKVMWGHGNKKEIPKTEPTVRIGYHLPLTCQNHGNKVFIEDPCDWEYTSGGCGESCRTRLPCGHTCMLHCHPFEHERVNCLQKCDKPCSTCGQKCSQACSDTCRCTYCERRNGGKKAMLKPIAKTYNLVQQPLPSASFHTHPQTLIDVAPPTPSALASASRAAPVIPETTSQDTGSTPEQWQAYANGGVKEEDKKVYQKRRAEEAQFQELISTRSATPTALPLGKLIQLSPKKRVQDQPSANTSLLIDLADDSVPTPGPSQTPAKGCRSSHREIFSYVGYITTAISDSKENDKSTPEVEMQETAPPVFNLMD